VVRGPAGSRRREPGRVLALVACAVGSLAVSVLGLVMALHAVGGAPSPTRVATSYITATAVAAFVPTPGGVGAMETALIASGIGLGLSPGVALGGVLVFRFSSYAVGIIPGGLSYRFLKTRGHI